MTYFSTRIGELISREMVRLPGNSKDLLVVSGHEFKVRPDIMVLYFPLATFQLQLQSMERD